MATFFRETGHFSIFFLGNPVSSHLQFRMTEVAMETADTPATSSEVNSSAVGIVDALPYIDLGYDEPGVREAVSLESISHI